MDSPTTSPIPLKRLEQIVTDVCNSTFAGVEEYDHPKTHQWNESIINKVLKAVMSEATPPGAAGPNYKFAVNTTIVQHAVPTAKVKKPTTSAPATEEDKAASGKKPSAGRRGLHSATAGYWNEKTDGMWSFKYVGDERGFDVVIMLIWIAI